MKKKSLLILPVLLLALAACNKEEDEVVEENPEITDTTDDDQGGDDGDQGGEEVVVGSRIILYDGELAGYTEGVYFENDASLTMAKTVADASGNVTYTLSGTASAMNTKQADEFYKNVAAAGDGYILVTITLKKGETLSWVSSDAPSVTNTMTYEECENEGSEDFIIRLSGVNPSGSVISGDSYVFTITDANKEEVTHTIDYSAVAISDSRIALTPGEVDNEKWTNDSSLCFDSVTVDSTGNVTYVLDGELSKMTEAQIGVFGANSNVDDEYVLITVTLRAGETVTWGTEINDEKTRCYSQYPNGMDVVLKVTSSGAAQVKFTIANSTAGTSVDYIIDLSAYVTSTGEDA